MEPTDEPLQAAESADTPASQSAVPVPPTPPVTEPVTEPEADSEADSDTDPVMEAEPAPAASLEIAAVPPTVETTPDPVITSTVTIPAQEASTDEGGEWDLLVEKIKAWIDSNQLGSLWNQAQLPLRLIGGLILFRDREHRLQRHSRHDQQGAPRPRAAGTHWCDLAVELRPLQSRSQ